MITKDQIAYFVKKFRTNETTILREFLQILFLKKLYAYPNSKDIYFKGGTALHLIFNAPRFSEDLDFTVALSEDKFTFLINKLFSNISKEEEITFKKKKTIAGKSWLLTATPNVLSYPVFVKLDFSFREKVLAKNHSLIRTEYPILFNNYVYHLSLAEIAAEKIRAVMTRKKGRDWYDLWFLLNQTITLNDKFIRQKLSYYQIDKLDKKTLLARLEAFSEHDFIRDLRPFLPINERQNLPRFFLFLKDYLKTNL